MRRRVAAPAGLSLDDLRILARLEGRPLPRGQALAAALGVSSSAAWGRIRSLRRLGALSFVSSVNPRPGMCECVTYLKVDWVDPRGLDLLDSWIVDDPAIQTAARVTGGYDYRLSSRHRDIRSADDWSRSLLSRPKVVAVVTQLVATVFNRPAFAAAILGTD